MSKIKNNYLFAVLLIIIVGFIITSSSLKKFDCDEFEAIHTTWKVASGENIYSDFFQNHNPFFYYLLAPVVLISGAKIATLYVLRFILALIFLLILFFIYKIGEIAFDKVTGKTALILAVPSLLFFKGAEIRPDIPMLLFELAGFYFLLAFFKNKKITYLIISGVLFSFSFLFLQKAIVFIFLIYIMIIYKLIRGTIRFKHLLFFTLAIIATLIPYFSYLFLTSQFDQYYQCCFSINRQWLVADHYSLNFVSYFIHIFESLISIIVLFFIALPFCRKDENHIWIILFSFSLFAFVATAKYPWAEYFLQSISLLVLISAYALKIIFKKNNYIFMSAFLIILSPSYFYLNNPITGIKRSVQKARYVLNITSTNDIVYDPYLHFNLFYNKDVSYYWMKYRGFKTDYISEAYYFIKTKKPKIISVYRGVINPRYPFITRHYYKSQKYRDLYIIKPHYLNDSIILKHYLKEGKEYLIPLIDAMSPTSLDFETVKNVGNKFFINKHYKRAKYWLRHALSKNPFCELCILDLGLIYKDENNQRKVEFWREKLHEIRKLGVGPFEFEKGSILEKFVLKQTKFYKNQSFPIVLYIDAPTLDRDHTAFVSFEKNGNFYFAKDFSLDSAVSYHEINKISGLIKIPQNIPSGTYNIYFTFRIPRTDYRYKVIKNKKATKSRKIMIKKITIEDRNTL